MRLLEYFRCKRHLNLKIYILLLANSQGRSRESEITLNRWWMCNYYVWWQVSNNIYWALTTYLWRSEKTVVSIQSLDQGRSALWVNLQVYFWIKLDFKIIFQVQYKLSSVCKKNWGYNKGLIITVNGSNF